MSPKNHYSNSKSKNGKTLTRRSFKRLGLINRTLAHAVTWILITIHVVIIALFSIDGPDSDNHKDWFTLLWASQNKALITFVIISLFATVPCLVYGFSIRGSHRIWLLFGSVLLTGIGVYFYGNRYVLFFNLWIEHG